MDPGDAGSDQAGDIDIPEASRLKARMNCIEILDRTTNPTTSSLTSRSFRSRVPTACSHAARR
jgi:hypothetical protein